MGTWYEDWFGSDEYLTVYAHRDDSEADALIAFLTKTLPIKAGESVLDMCCGAGRHSIAFGNNGCNVTGVDLSENLIRIAKNRAAGNPRVKFIRSNITEFHAAETFDVVVNLFTSFGYTGEDKQNFSFFDVAFKSVNKDGFFVFDYLNKNQLIETLVPFTSEHRDNVFIEQFRWIENNAINKRIVLQNTDSLHSFSEHVKLYAKDEIEAALKFSGFTSIVFYGDYLGSPFDEGTSPRLLAVCKP